MHVDLAGPWAEGPLGSYLIPLQLGWEACKLGVCKDGWMATESCGDREQSEGGLEAETAEAGRGVGQLFTLPGFTRLKTGLESSVCSAVYRFSLAMGLSWYPGPVFSEGH